MGFNATRTGKNRVPDSFMEAFRHAQRQVELITKIAEGQARQILKRQLLPLEPRNPILETVFLQPISQARHNFPILGRHPARLEKSKNFLATPEGSSPGAIRKTAVGY
jgi:hypothetical protein